MQVDDRRTRSFLGIMEPPRWNSGIWQRGHRALYLSHRRKNIDKRNTLQKNEPLKEGVEVCERKLFLENLFFFFWSYRRHGNRDVKVLASVVLLVGEEVVPNLTNTET